MTSLSSLLALQWKSWHQWYTMWCTNFKHLSQGWFVVLLHHSFSFWAEDLSTQGFWPHLWIYFHYFFAASLFHQKLFKFFPMKFTNQPFSWSFFLVCPLDTLGRTSIVSILVLITTLASRTMKDLVLSQQLRQFTSMARAFRYEIENGQFFSAKNTCTCITTSSAMEVDERTH